MNIVCFTFVIAELLGEASNLDDGLTMHLYVYIYIYTYIYVPLILHFDKSHAGPDVML